MSKKTEQKVEIGCRGADNIAMDELHEMQGELKSLSTDNYQRLKRQILNEKFSEPLTIWIDPEDQKKWILNGHQRFRTLQRMIHEGISVPKKLPVSIIEAETRQEAARLVLSLASQYGKVDGQGLYEFVNTENIQVEEMFTSFNFPEIDLPSWTEEYFPSLNDDEVMKEMVTFEAKEMSSEDFENFDHKCPKCGFEFDDK